MAKAIAERAAMLESLAQKREALAALIEADFARAEMELDKAQAAYTAAYKKRCEAIGHLDTNMDLAYAHVNAKAPPKP